MVARSGRPTLVAATVDEGISLCVSPQAARKPAMTMHVRIDRISTPRAEEGELR